MLYAQFECVPILEASSRSTMTLYRAERLVVVLRSLYNRKSASVFFCR